jgi:hypothetical protein
MSSNSLIPTLQVTAIGQFAFEMLASRRHLEVLAAFSQAVYFRTDRQELIWMSAAGSPMHRRCLQCDSLMPGLEVGTILPLQESQPAVKNGYRLDIQQAVRWNEPSLKVTGHPSPSAPGKRLLPVLQHLLDGDQPEGLGLFLPVFLEGWNSAAQGSEDGRLGSLSPVIRQIMERVLTCLRQKEYAGLPQAALNLIGLGEGLTPSGDDFLGGLFFARLFMEHTFPGAITENWNYSEFIRNARNLTNEISFTLLQEHALGHTWEPLHELATGLLEDCSTMDLLPHMRRLVTIGHSTGWDLLTGFSIGLLTACGW